MKHKLLFALAGAAMMSMSAMAWDEPTKPEKLTFPQYEGKWVAPENDGTYYIYNVGTGQFLGCGFDWGTRAVTTTAAVLSLDDEVWACGANKNTIIPFMLHQTDVVNDLLEDETLQGTWQIMNLNTNKSASAQYLCHEANAAWIDGGQDRRNIDKNGFWKIEAAGDAYEFLPLDGQEGNSIVYGVHLPNLASARTVYTWTDLQNNEDAAALWKFVSTDDVESIRAYIESEAVAAFEESFTAYNEKVTLYNARLALYNTLLNADKYGANTSEAGAVYTNDEATVEELNAANTALQEAIKPLAVEYGCKNSSEENPFEVTSYVMTNADFSAQCDNGATPPGWEITIKGQNVGQQNRTDTNSETGAAITNFLEAWIPQPGTLGNGYAGQWITGLPQGRYRLEMDATACQQSNAYANEDLTGVSLFVGTGAYNIVGDPVQTGEMMVTHYTFDFDFNAEKLLVGLLVENTNCNWISADNFRLFAIGEMQEDPVVKGLRDAIEKAQAIDDQLADNSIEDDYMNVSAEARNAFTTALNNAKAAIGGSSDAMKEAVSALGEATEALEASAALYKQFQAVYNDAMLTAQNLQTAGQWPDLQDEINDYAEEELTNAFNAGTLTEDDLEEAQNKVANLISAYLNDPEKIQVGDDLTVLLVNPHFTMGTTADPTGWTINSGSMTELAAATHNIETYHKAFDLSQTLKNMPAGVYDVTLQGFARHDGGDTDKTWLYGGITKAQLISLNDAEDQGRDEPIYFDGSVEHPYIHDGNYDYNGNNADGWYTANGMGGSYYWFQETNPNTGEPYYTNHVKVVLDKAGDLTIGIHCETTTDWVIFDNFGIVYKGQDLQAYYEMIAAKGEELNTAEENNLQTTHSEELYADLEAKLENAGDITSVDDALALLAELETAIEYIKAGQKLYDELSPLVDEYSTMAEELSIDDITFLTILENLSAKIAAEDYFADNEEIAKGIEDIKKGWIPAVVSSAQEGDELLGIILNPTFDSDANNWTITGTETDEEGNTISVGQNQGYQGASYTNAETGLAIDHFIESWRPSTHLNNGTIAQTIAYALPEGYYQLQCDGYAVNQTAAGGLGEEELKGVYLWASCGGEERTESIVLQATEATPTTFQLDFHSNGKALTTVGILVQDANCNWVAVDNFRLYYLGTEAPVAVEGLAAESVAAPKAIFTIDGRQSSTLRRGINIVRKADGSVQKVMVK